MGTMQQPRKYGTILVLHSLNPKHEDMELKKDIEYPHRRRDGEKEKGLDDRGDGRKVEAEGVLR